MIDNKRFPPLVRLKICSFIFKMIIKTPNPSQISVFKNLKNTDEFKEWKIKLINFEPYVDEYVNDLIKILLKLNKLKLDFHAEFSKPLSIHNLSKEFYNEGVRLGLSLSQFERILNEMFDYLKKRFPNEFKLKRIRKGKGNLFNNEVYRTNIYIKKFKMLFELKNPNELMKNPNFTLGRYEGRCARLKCKTDITSLPALEFHHLDNSLKTITWNKMYSKNYIDIKNVLEKEKVIPVCRNCHELITKKLFNDFRNIILKKNLFYDESNLLRSAKNINTIINKELKQHPCIVERVNKKQQSLYSIKFQIKGWIKKRFIIDQIFEGRCQGCRDITTIKNLPCLGFHHLNPRKKRTYWSKALPNLSIKDIIQGLIEEKCTCLCANCHSIIESKYYEKNIEKIYHTKNDLGEYYIDNLDEKIKQAKVRVAKIEDHLNKEIYSIKNKNPLDGIDYLSLETGYGNAWKKYLLAIYKQVLSTGKNSLRPSDLKIPNTGRNLKILIQKDFINLTKEKKGVYKIYSITKKGIKEVENINQKYETTT